MKIERKGNKVMVEFGSLKEGETFEYDYDGTFWIKTDEAMVLNTLDTRNCISLSDGSSEYVFDTTKVRPYPNAKVVLEDE